MSLVERSRGFNSGACKAAGLNYNHSRMGRIQDYYRSQPKHRRVFTTIALLGLTAAIGYSVVMPIIKSVHRQRKVTVLRTADGERAKRAAWWVVDGQRLKYAPVVREALKRPEISADFREALVYALGRIQDPDAVAVLRQHLETETDGYVRQATWLALSRVDADAFRETVATTDSESRSDWDELGIAQGRLETGDFAAAATALRYAREGGKSQKQIACRALEKTARPVLELAGYWPIEFEPNPGDIWPDELIDEVDQRLAWVDPDHIIADTLQHQKLAAGVQRNVRRIVDGRDHIAWFLFWIRD